MKTILNRFTFHINNFINTLRISLSLDINQKKAIIPILKEKAIIMEMIMNEYDMVIGAVYDNGTIQDYVDDNNTYGLVRIDDTMANWFLYNKEDSTPEIHKLFEEVTKKDHYIKDDFGEMIVVFGKKGKVDYKTLVEKIDAYLDYELSNII